MTTGQEWIKMFENECGATHYATFVNDTTHEYTSVGYCSWGEFVSGELQARLLTLKNAGFSLRIPAIRSDKFRVENQKSSTPYALSHII